MNNKRAIGIALLIYLGSMVIGMIACTIMGITPDLTQPIPMKMWIITAFVSVGLSIAGAYWYFLGKNLKPDLRAGLRFGGVVLIVGFVLDFLFFQSLRFEGYDPVTGMKMYYSQPMFWVTLVLVLLGAGAMGWWLENNKKTGKS